VSFVEEKKWEKTEPISKWKDPNSVQMSLVSYFFKISMALRAVHNRLVEEYGIPYWGSYVLFAFATILLGALLGLLIVFMIDLFFPAAPIVTEHETRTGSRADVTPAPKDEGDGEGVRRRKPQGDPQEKTEEMDSGANDNEGKKYS